MLKRSTGCVLISEDAELASSDSGDRRVDRRFTMAVARAVPKASRLIKTRAGASATFRAPCKGRGLWQLAQWRLESSFRGAR